MRCAIYIRVSTNKEEQKSSLENQRELFYRYIGDKGWDVHEFYVDVETGTTDKRSSLQRLISDAKQRKFDVILAKELSRLARNGKLSYEIQDIAMRNRIDIITLDGAINTVEGNSSNFGLFAWLYEQESQRTSERIKSSFASKARRGEFKGSIPPYGYDVAGGVLTMRDDDTPSVVRRIFEMYLQGIGFDAIARTLTREEYPTPAQIAGKRNAGKYWHGSTIKLILTNPHYTGDLVQCREKTLSVTVKARETIPLDQQIVIPNSHQTLISREQFDLVQEMMQGRKKKRPKAKKHLFTNVAFCADCGQSMWYIQYRKGYVCGKYQKHGKYACEQHTIKEATLISIILDDIRELSRTLDEVEVLGKIKASADKERKLRERQVAELEKKMVRLRDSKNALIKKLADGIITDDDYQEFVANTNHEIHQLQEQVQQLKLSAQSNGLLDLERMKQEIQSFLKLDELTPEMLHQLVEKIEVQVDGTPKIYYRFTNPL
ncbi:recombinase family protein [Brevibacillus centrosporus]|uniref:recombinase family protein n=1 Tax=Brevibacillus centrosporus TaxID=54910 RepID=UPI003829E26C